MQNAFAKVILFGEHAVVHGRLAVAAALDRGARASAKLQVDRAQGAELVVPKWEHVARASDAEHDELARAYRAILERAGALHLALRTEVEIEVPGGAGLGCSAAMGVAIARAVIEARGGAREPGLDVACATAWERVFHGNPSGIDVAAAARGGLLSFRRGQAPVALSSVEPLELAVVFTGEASSTKTMVESVARQLARRPEVVERTFDGVEQLAQKGIAALAAGRLYEVGRLMDLNQALLSSLLVSTEKLEEVCHVARAAGALGAKLTGGGGGGCAIALGDGSVEPILEAWRARGYDGFRARIPAYSPPIEAAAP